MWPKTWNSEAIRICKNYGDTTVPLRGELHGAKNYVDALIARADDPPSILFDGLCREAVGHLKHIGQWNSQDMANLLIRKQHDYGHGNINAFGYIGLIVRLSDKVARLINLDKRRTVLADPMNESALDSWVDIVGYCVIASMLESEVFNLPLEGEDEPE